VAASALEPPAEPPLKAQPARETAAQFAAGARLDYPRLDLPAKVNGALLFAGDVRLPGMLHAAIRHGPIGESRLNQFDSRKPRGIAGVHRLVAGKGWLAAVAETWWSAEQALAAVSPTFSVGERPETQRIDRVLEEALRFGDASRLHEAGDPQTYLYEDFSHAARYGAAAALHGTVETASATARFHNGMLELWIGSQAPDAALRAVAQALDLNERDVTLYPMPAGGSFDRRLENDHAIEVALIARDVGRPVQLTWSRWQEHVAGWPRPPVSAVLAARTAPTGEVVGWKARLAVPAAAREFGHRLFGGLTEQAAIRAAAGKFDPMAIEGAIPPYAIEHMAIDHVPVTTGLPAGRMRGNAHGYTAFFNESFIDELAHRAGREPLSYRMAMLGHDPRLAACLQRVSGLAQWNGGNDSSGQGLACHAIGEGRIAAVATARRDENGVRVDRISAVADIGRIVNLDIARQQIEGGLIFGVGLALGSTMDYVDGLPVHGRLALLNLPRLADCPEVQVEFIDSNADPVDPGELGVAVAAPAIANALFSATGLRFRMLPLLSEEV
jgi:isoquinoline 1-oxidoreductase beta subunit